MIYPFTHADKILFIGVATIMVFLAACMGLGLMFCVLMKIWQGREI